MLTVEKIGRGFAKVEWDKGEYRTESAHFGYDQTPETARIRTPEPFKGRIDKRSDDLTIKAVMTLWGMKEKDAREAVILCGGGTTQEVIAKISRVD